MGEVVEMALNIDTENKRDKSITIDLSAAERKALKTRANDASLTVTKIVQAMILDYIGSSSEHPERAAADLKYRELQREVLAAITAWVDRHQDYPNDISGLEGMFSLRAGTLLALLRRDHVTSL
jgi:hypothetical protein